MFQKSADWSKYLEGIPATEFVGYEHLNFSDAKLLKEIDTEEGQKVLIFDKTPFYPEMGGQNGDAGVIELDDGRRLEIVNVQKVAGVILHFVGEDLAFLKTQEMRLEEKLATLFHHQKISSVLDLGAGNGRRSIFCASYGAKVVAIDNQSKPNRQFPEYLTLHPAIHFFQADLKELPRPCDQRYDLILLFNVIIFLKKSFVLSQLLPSALSQLSQ